MTETISSSDRDTYLRARRQGIRLYLAVYRPDAVLECSLATAPASGAVAEITIGSITVGAIEDAKADYALKVWDSTGVRFKGWLRLRADGSGTTLYVAEAGETFIDWEVGDLLKVYPWYRPVAKYHKYNASADRWDIDYNINYTDENGQAYYRPMARVGGPAIGFRDDSGNCTLKFVGNRSSAYSLGGALASYNWQFPESMSDTNVGTEAAPVSKTFTQAHAKGELFSLTVTDTGSHTDTRYNVMWTFDREGNDAPYKVAVAGVSSSLGQGGRAVIQLYGQYDKDALPAGAYVVLFGEVNYDGTIVENIGSTHPYRTNILFAGYIMQEAQHLTGKSGDVQYTELQCATVDAMLQRAACYPVEMKNTTGTPADWQTFQYLNIDRALVHWSKYRALFNMHDLNTPNAYGSAGNYIQFLDLPTGKLWQQLEYLGPNTIMGIAGSSLLSNVYVDAWHQVTADARRWLSSALDITEPDDCQGDITIQFQDTHDYSQNVVPGVSGTTPLFARAPDDPKGYFGVLEDQPPGLALQTENDLLEMTGKLHAWKNRDVRSVTIPLRYYAPIDANPQTLVNLTINTTYHPRADARWSSGVDLLVTQVNHTFHDDHLALTTLTAEPSIINAPDGVAFEIPQNPQVPYDQYMPPPWEWDDAFDEDPLFGEIIDSDAVGDGLACTDAGIYATHDLGQAFLGNDPTYEGLNRGLPSGAIVNAMRIYRFGAGENTWEAVALVETTDLDTAGIYWNSDVWNLASLWEIKYSETQLRSDVGGTVGYASVDASNVSTYNFDTDTDGWYREADFCPWGSTDWGCWWSADGTIYGDGNLGGTPEKYVNATLDLGGDYHVTQVRFRFRNEGVTDSNTRRVRLYASDYTDITDYLDEWYQFSSQYDWTTTTVSFDESGVRYINVRTDSDLTSRGKFDWIEVTYADESAGTYTTHFTQLSTIGDYVLATAIYEVSGTVYQALVRCTDGGDTWALGAAFDTFASDSILPSSGTHAVSAYNPGHVWVAGLVGSNITIQSSTDGGASWSNLYVVGTDRTNDAITDIHMPYEANSSEQILYFAKANNSLYRSGDGGSTFTALTMPSGWESFVKANCIHTYTSDSDVLAVGNDHSQFAVSLNANEATPTFTLKTALDGSPHMVGGWPTDAAWFAVPGSAFINVSDDQGGTWYDAWGNLSDFGATMAKYFIPKDF